MIIYVNIDKNTGEIMVNNDMYPNSDVVIFNPNTLRDTQNNTQFEIAFNTSSFEEKILLTTETNDGNNN